MTPVTARTRLNGTPARFPQSTRCNQIPPANKPRPGTGKERRQIQGATGHAGTEKGRYLEELAVNDGIGCAALGDYEDHQQGERQNDSPTASGGLRSLP